MAIPDGITQLASLEALLLEREKYYRALLSPVSQRGYKYDWRVWVRWCEARGITPFPTTAESVSLYVVDLLAGDRKTATVARLVAGIKHRHRSQSQSVEWDRVDQLLRGARRMRQEGLDQSAPLLIEDLRQISIALGKTNAPRDIRNRAILVAGFASGLRASSLVALQFGDVEMEKRGAVLHVRREKTNQEGKERRLIGLPLGKHAETCSVSCLRAWMKWRGSFPGPLFTHCRDSGAINRGLCPEHICEIVQGALRRIGRDFRGYGSHSLRSGLITAAAERDIEVLRISGHTGHKSLNVLRRYFRRRDVFRANVCDALDL